MFALRPWAPELAAIAGSLSCLISLIIILMAYDGRHIFSWHGITLNAIVSVLSTASKAVLLVAIEGTLSQWKWILFANKSRPLIDFERIDSASRGPLGSLVWLWKGRTTIVSRVGALLVLMGLALDPFAQQLVQYREALVCTQDNQTITLKAQRYSKGAEYTPFNSLHADLSMQSAVLYGLNKPLDKVLQQSTFSCATGNCTWPSFESLSVCSRCSDVTGELKPVRTVDGMFFFVSNNTAELIFPLRGHGGGTALQLPNGLFIDRRNGDRYRYTNGSLGIVFTSFGTGNASQTVSMQDIDTLIWSLSMIRVSANPSNASAAWPDLATTATECALYYCVNRYNVSVANGSLAETVRQVEDAERSAGSWQEISPSSVTRSLRTISNGHKTSNLSSSIEFDIRSARDHTDLMLISPGTGNRFNLSNNAVYSISGYFQDNFASDQRIHDRNGSISGRINGYYGQKLGVDYYEPSILQAMSSSDDLDATFAAVATSMSSALRTDADESFEGGSRAVLGSQGTMVTFYQISWRWISLHCVFVILGSVFTGLTIWRNRGRGRGACIPAWKSSALAVLSRGPAVKGILRGQRTLKRMETRAEWEKIMLIMTDEKSQGL